jgi:hypothetical protein
VHYFLQKMDWATHWAIFSQTHPVTLPAADVGQQSTSVCCDGSGSQVKKITTKK